jgi:lactate dehydrogenase-like 2-hydroxyacid dehydrogenase
LQEKIKNVSGLLCLITDNIDEKMVTILANSPSENKVVSQMAVGVDNIDVPACTQRNIPVGHTPGVLTHATADLTMALLLATARQLIPSAEAIKAGKWQTWQPMGFVGPDVYGSTVGIVGMGRIGFAVAQRLQGFNVNLLYHNRTPHSQAQQVNATFCPDLSDLLAQSDFVILLTALTPETHHLINAERLAQMKPTATLINVARGGVVDQDALIHALQNNIIAQAGLDVMTPEPIPAYHPLLQLPNATVLPHIGSASQTARTRMAQIAAENLVAGVRGERLVHCVNPEIYQ